MLIGGFQRLSLIDFPGVISSIIFTSGCNFRCPYCHNPDLVRAAPEKIIAEETVLDSLLESRKMIDGVVVSGGEPTLHSDLPAFLRKLKSAGFLVKLDTNGTNPALLSEVVSGRLVDYVAMDLKAPLEKYAAVVGGRAEAGKIAASMAVLRSSPTRYEFRTTVFPGVLEGVDYEVIAKLLIPGESYYLQDIHYVKTLGDLTDPGARDSARLIAARLQFAFPALSSGIFSR